jgi:hypothetical protein
VTPSAKASAKPSASRRSSLARYGRTAGDVEFCGRWRYSTNTPGKFRRQMLPRFLATSQMFENTKPSMPRTAPWKPSSSDDFATEQTNDWKRASACVSSTEAPPPRSPSGSMPAAWITSAGAHTG